MNSEWNNSIGQDREHLMRTVDLFLWLGCFLFFALIISIWFWLGEKIKRKGNRESGELDIIDEENQSEVKSPIRLFSTRIQRTISRIKMDSP
jgi:hypothetical protein